MSVTAAKEAFDKLYAVAPTKANPLRARLVRAANLVNAEKLPPGEKISPEKQKKKEEAYKAAADLNEAVRDEANAAAYEAAGTRKLSKRAACRPRSGTELRSEFKFEAMQVRALDRRDQRAG